MNPVKIDDKIIQKKKNVFLNTLVCPREHRKQVERVMTVATHVSSSL